MGQDQVRTMSDIRVDLRKIRGEDIHTARVYHGDDPNYLAGCTVQRNPDGLYEPFAWVSRVGKDNAWYHKECVEEMWRRGWQVAFTFQKEKMKLYRRLLRSTGKLVVLKEFEEEYNGQMIQFCYGFLWKEW